MDLLTSRDVFTTDDMLRKEIEEGIKRRAKRAETLDELLMQQYREYRNRMRYLHRALRWR